ncbi:MAG TPA: aldo/keto reductase [Clostridia bacterium]|nr:aldo/keto reductase [Clostridia bacterium]
MNRIPKTEISVSPVTLGTMTYGSPVAFDDAVKLTRYALSQGVNHIDTANMYEGYNRYAGSAGGVAEEIVGSAIKGMPRGSVIVSTKVGMKVGDAPEDEGTSANAIEKQLDASLRRMKTDYIDLYYLHRYDANAPLPEILTALQKAVFAGKIRYYGVSNYSAEQLSALLKAADELGLPRPVVCQPPLSLLKQDALSALIPLCAAEDLAVIPYQIYQGGLLTGKYKRGAEPPKGSRAEEKPAWLAAPDDTIYDKLEAIEQSAKARGISMSAYALRWTLEQPAVVSAIVGVKSDRQVDDALAALR